MGNTHMSRDKLVSIEQAASLVRDGDLVALQNMASQIAPMAMVRELIRQRRRNLGLICILGGIPVDWLAAAGVIDRFLGPAVSMEQFGLCQPFRRGVESGRLKMIEVAEGALLTMLGAATRGLPFLPSKSMIGTDLIALNPDLFRMIDDPFGGTPLVACRALTPDVALIHAHMADRAGNVQIDAGPVGPDLGIMPKAARRVIVTVEEIVESDVLRRNPDRTVIPGFVVDALVHVPHGAHPTSLFPRYGYDAAMHAHLY